MHPDIHLRLHHDRAAKLRHAAPPRRTRPHPRIRTQLGWTLVELGLRLVSSSGVRRPCPAPAAPRPSPSAS
ncbi:hypothetical protein DMA15_13805 [Streptomyces sp. WAC 01529]|nr:hypothetical protein [Streptomyces sp. WAC 01529]AZM53519.1 hypothetical protein DMA15_13805 [Streptomyces sp. WAC 01529]